LAHPVYNKVSRYSYHVGDIQWIVVDVWHAFVRCTTNDKPCNACIQSNSFHAHTQCI